MVLAVLLSVPHGFAGRPAFTADPGYVIDTWETEDGLPENSATAMAQTPDGYLWFGTFNGLVRFDGVKFTIFNPQNTPQLPSAGIVNLHADRRGWLWVSTYGGLVARIGAEWRNFGKEQVTPADFVRTFSERGNGDLLVTTFGGDVAEFANERFVTLPPPPGAPGKGYLGSIDEASQWWAVQNQFIGRWDGRQWTHTVTNLPGLTAEAVGAGAARDGGLWLLLGKELRKYRKGAEVSRVALTESPGGFWSLFEDSSTNLWISTHDRGICVVAPDGSLSRWSKDNGLPATGTRFAFEDREQNVWVGTSGGGLMRFKPRRFQNIGFERGLVERVTRSVSAHPDGSVWIGTYGRGLFRLGETGLTHVPFSTLTRSPAYVQCVLVDRDARIWAGTYESGLRVSDPTGFRLVPIERPSGDNFLALFQDSRGGIWASDGQGVVVFDSGGSRRYGSEQGLPRSGVNCFAEDGEGSLWLSNSRGVFRLEKDRFVEVRDDANRSITEVGCLKNDADGTLWMGTMNNGLLRRKRGSLARIDAGNGLPVAGIHGILEDDQHFFWMSSSRGVVRAHRKDLDSVADGGATRLNCQLMDLSDGLPSVECASGQQPTCTRDARGRLWFATVKGVAMTDPARFRLNTNPPPVHVEKLVYHTLARGKGAPSRPDETEVRMEAPLAERLMLPAGSRRVEIHYAALSFTAPEKVRFQVRLEGQETDWQDAGSQRMALFHDVRPGDYTFRVRAANNDGVWNETGASLAFTVQPFLWQTMWFRIGMVLLLAGGSAGTVGSVAATRRRRERREFEREQAHSATLLALSGHPAVAAGDLPAAFREICEQAARTLGVSRVGIWLLDEKSGELRSATIFDAATRQHGSDQVLPLSGAPRYLEALQAERVVAVRDVRNDPRTAELSEHHFARPGVASVLDAPVRVSDKLAAVIRHEQSGLPRDWKHDEVTFASEMAGQVARTLLNAEREDANRQVRESEARLKEAEQSAREVSGKLITAQEDERRRIARDLHDDLNQRLALLSVETDLLGQMENSAPAQAMIEDIAAHVRDLASEVHKLSYQLHPAKLEQLGLVSATRSFCQEIAKQFGVPVEFVYDAVPRDLNRDVALCLYRLIQESLRNTLKHSRATRARVELRMEAGELRLVVSDNGCGFDSRATAHYAGLGLLGMRERVRLVHGRIAFQSAPGEGTRIEVSVPLTLNAPIS